MNTKLHHSSPQPQLSAWLLTSLLVWGSVCTAAQAPTEDSLWYYEIGGAEPVSVPANPSVVSVTLGGSAQLGHSSQRRQLISSYLVLH
jgi:hypothetical protein